MKEIWVEDESIASKYGFKLKTQDSGVELIISSIKDLEKAREAEKKKAERIFAKCSNWKTIPLENLLAACKKTKIIMEVESAEEAKLALQTLEKGACGVLLKNAGDEQAKELMKFLSGGTKTELKTARVVEVKKMPLGARSCIDTSELMDADEGMLVGCSSSGFLLIQAEVTENPHVATRPFRVNCGAASMYALLDEGKTRYLNELQAGDELTITNKKGETRKAFVVRNKIEWRPLLLIEAEAEGKRIKAIVQDAETIRVLTPKGSASVAELKKGSEVIVRLEEERARHFGMKVDERIIEK